jgi:hypothetical protein
VVIGILTPESQYFDIVWGFPTCGFWGEKDNRAGNRPGMDSNAPGPSEDASNRGSAIDLMTDNPNQFWYFWNFPTLDPQHFEHFEGFPLRILNILNYLFQSPFLWILRLFKINN